MSYVDRLRHRLIDGRPGGRPGRIVEFGKTMLVVVPLTAMIWIYAERAQRVTDIKLSLLLSAAPAEPNMVAQVTEPDREPLTIALDGTRGQIENLRRQIENGLDDGRYRLTLSGVDATVGPHTIDATQLFNRDSLFVSSGVTVTGTSPAQIKVNIEPFRNNVPATVALLKDKLKVELLNYTFEPATVTLSGPQSALPYGDPIVYADPSGLTARDEQGAQTMDVPLVSPNKDLKLSTTKVKMTYTAGTTVTNVTVPTVFIDVVRPAGDVNSKTRVILRDGNVHHNVLLRGPTNLVNKYTGETPLATLRPQLVIKHEDIGQPASSRQLVFPPIEGGQVKVEGGPYEVTFEVRED